MVLLASRTLHCIFLLVLFLPLSIHSATVYKYKDANGRWQFTDKPPKEQRAQAQVLEFKPEAKDPLALQFQYETVGKVLHAYVVNPFHLPIEAKIFFKNNALPEVTVTIPANGRTVFYRNEQKMPRFRYRYTWGEPNSRHNFGGYRLPVSSFSQHHISQGFNGRFSHTKPSSRHAVDIALPIGTDIVAARAGVVAFVRDDYAFGGAKKYFLDKANVVYVLHDDGTYALYAHLLMGSVVVKAGQSVKAGDVLGLSGTSGFSTGPHLHFVIRKNSNFKTISVPFKFIDERGLFTPERKQKICPCR